MTEVSLTAAIFGERNPTKEGSLSNLFDSSSSTVLPATPNNVNFPVTLKSKATESKKRKGKEEAEIDNDVSQAPRKEENKSSEKKKRKTKKKPEEEGDDQVKANEGETNDNNEEDGIVNIDDEERTIFVGNLPFDISRKTLEGIFKKCGKIKNSRLRSFGTSGVKVAPEHAGNQVSLLF